MATCERCGLSKWFLSLSDNGLCPACAEAELKEAAEKSHAPTREIDKPAQTAIRSDSPTVDSLARVPSLQEEPIPHFDKYVGQEEIRKDLLPRIEARSEEHTSELQSLRHLVCRLLLEKQKKKI